MDLQALRAALEGSRIEWQRHALERMIERGIGRTDVLGVLAAGDVIEDYPDDRQFPAALFFGQAAGEPLHVVAALDLKEHRIFVITVYRPDLTHFATDFRTRRTP